MSNMWCCIDMMALLILSDMNFMSLLHSDGTAIPNWPVMLYMCEYSNCAYIFLCIIININFFISISVIHYYKGDLYVNGNVISTIPKYC